MTKMEEKFTIREDILSDLCSRFIVNVPEDERSDMIRLFFQIELAHWFYLDFYCDTSFSNMSSSSSGGSSGSSGSSSADSASDSSDDEDESFENLVKQHPTQSNLSKPCSIRVFAENIFRYCPFLMQHSNQVDDILSKWKVFKHALPTNGAIMLDESMRYVLLVQGFWAKASWGFPKGKVIEEETEEKCAIREVLEETGYDISDKLAVDEYLQININDQTIRLYMITDVSMQTKFEPRTRREIKEVRWFAIDELPVHRKDNRCKDISGFTPNSFFMVIPFVKALKKWIAIKNSVKSGQNYLNYGNIISNRASKLLKSSQERSHSTINHKRTNSISHSNSYYANGNSNYNNNGSGHHNNNHHNHSLNHFSNNHSTNNQYDNNSNRLNKAISKSNENLFFQHQSPFNNNKKTPNNKKSKISIKNSFSSAHKNNGENIIQNGLESNNESKMQNIQKQAHFYQKMQQNDFSDLLGFKEAALANKTNKLTNSISNNQLITSSSSKFKPVILSKNKPNNSLNHYQFNNNPNDNNNKSNLNKSISKSNENLNQSPFNKKNNTPRNQIRYNNNNNPFLKHYTNSKTNENNNNTADNNNSDSKLKSQQTQFYQRMQQNEFADILSFKEAALANKSNNQTVSNRLANSLISSSSKFKPVNSNNSSSSKCNKMTNNNNNQLNDLTNNKKSSNNSANRSLSFNNSNNQKYSNQNIDNIKKQLEFNGPECWLNFRFDYESILQSLPPMLKL